MELDIVALVDPFRPTLAIAEVKSQQAIDESDVGNLEWLQGYLRAKGVDCITLFATFRPRLDLVETEMLRRHCDRYLPAIRSNDSRLSAALPIVLTANDLSVDQFSEDHPWKWADPVRAVPSVAEESCRRNL
jgi:hypothetical protein